eukprot:g1566.t1
MRSNLFWGANTISAIASAIATLMSFHLMYKHAKYYCVKSEQKHIIRILWMIPIYAVDCAIATWKPNWSKYVDPMRDCYEAYVLYCFVALLVAFLRVERSGITRKFEGHTIHHLLPFNLCFSEPLPVNRRFFRKMETGVIQYMVLKPFLAITQLVLTACDAYEEEGIFDFSRGYAWILWLTNFSQTIALYCLFYIYHAIHNLPELQSKRLFGKFICIKAVVFFAFWQAFAFSVLEYAGIIKDTDDMTASVRAAAIDDFILCVEMVIIAYAHRHVFSYFEYRAVIAPVAHALKTHSKWRNANDPVNVESLPAEYRAMSEEEIEAAAEQERLQRVMKISKRNAMLETVDVSDITSDIRDHLIPQRSISKELRPRSASGEVDSGASKRGGSLSLEIDEASNLPDKSYEPPTNPEDDEKAASDK